MAISRPMPALCSNRFAQIIAAALILTVLAFRAGVSPSNLDPSQVAAVSPVMSIDSERIPQAPPAGGAPLRSPHAGDDAVTPLVPVGAVTATPHKADHKSPRKYDLVGGGSQSLRWAFEHWLVTAKCTRPLRTQRRDQRVLEAVWSSGSRADEASRNAAWAPINDADRGDSIAKITRYVAENSAFTTPVPKFLRPAKPVHLAIIVNGGNHDMDREMSKLFGKTHVVGGGRKMRIQSCNEESWLRIVACVAHLVQFHSAGGLASVTLINLSNDANPPNDPHTKASWLCSLHRMLKESESALADESSGGMFAISMQETAHAVSDKCRLWSFVEDVAHWLTSDEYDTKWSVRQAHLKSTAVVESLVPLRDTASDDSVDKQQPAAGPSTAHRVIGAPSRPPSAAAAVQYVAKHYAQQHKLRFMHVPMSLLPFFASISAGWRLFDVSVEEGIAIFTDMLLINADRLKLRTHVSVNFAEHAHPFDFWAPNATTDCAATQATLAKRPATVDPFPPEEQQGFAAAKRRDTLWTYPVLDVGSGDGESSAFGVAPGERKRVNANATRLLPPRDGVPKSWREQRRQRTPAILMNMKNNDIMMRPFVAKYLDAMQKHHRRFAPLSMKPTRHNSFVPHVSAFCGCGNDYVGCVYALMRSKFFTRGGGFIFMHADAYFAPQPWFGNNNMRHIVASTEHPLTEGLAPQTIEGRWKKATQGPEWVFHDHHLSAVRGRRPDTGFAHVRHFQEEIASYFAGYIASRRSMSKSLHDTVPNVVFGDLAHFPDSAMEAVNLIMQHMFPHMMMSEPATGWMASLSSHMTNIPRHGYAYVGGCCYGTDPEIIRRDPAGHRVDLNRGDVMDTLTQRIESSFSCVEKHQAPQLRPGVFELLSSTTCAMHVALPVRVSADAKLATSLEIINAFTNEIIITVVPATDRPFVSRAGEAPRKDQPFDKSGKFDATVDIILMTTNVNEVTVKGRKGQLMNLKLRVTLATGVWQETALRVRPRANEPGEPGLVAAAFELDEDSDTLIISHEGFFDALTIDIDTSSPDRSRVTVDGGALVVKAEIGLALAAQRLSD